MRGAVGGAAAAAVASARCPGSAPRAQTAPPPASAVGAWSPVYPWPRVAVHAHLLPNGRILTYSDDDTPLGGDPSIDYSEAHVVRIPAAGPPSASYVHVPNATINLFCAGHAFLPDGRLLVVGGQEGYYGVGSARATLFEHAKGYAWTDPAGGVMRARRWYPSVLRLPNGEALALGGTVTKGVPNTVPEVWMTAGGWRALTTAQLQVPLYPWVFPVNGKVFMAGTTPKTRWLDTAGTGRWTSGPLHLHAAAREAGTAVQYDDGKILVAGGPATDTAETIDLRTSPPSWQFTAPLRYRRQYLNATVLPDGTILATGGGAHRTDASQAVLAAEMWDPATRAWSEMASMQVGRLYHSTALLLPDARVLSAGGGRATSSSYDRANAEIYSPPYLFRGPRPTISSAPASVRYGEPFPVATPDAGAVAAVSWIGLGSVTHSFNMGQSFRRLAFAAGDGGLTVTAPVDANLSTPGHYMLFILNGRGVPSKAKIVRIG